MDEPTVDEVNYYLRFNINRYIIYVIETMDLKNKYDRIISRTYNEEYAFVEIDKMENIPYFYKAKLLTNSFPQKLIDLINEYAECVNGQMFSILDKIARAINMYDLWLSENHTKIFDIWIEGDFIYFCTKFSTVSGFLDDYPS